MAQVIYEQNIMLVVSVLLGAAMAFTYDWLRIVRRVICHSNFFVAIEDILFWFIWTVIVILSIQKYGYGQLRIYIFIGIIVGATLYLTTISCAFVFLVSRMLCVVKKCVEIPNKMLKNGVKRVKIKISLCKKDSSAQREKTEKKGYGNGKKVKKKGIN